MEFTSRSAEEGRCDASGDGHPFVVEFSIDSGRDWTGLRLGTRPRVPDDAVARAAQAAKDSDGAIVVVGYDSGWESEGADRPHMNLPGKQDELIRAVAAANPRTVVVINAGAPVAMPWADAVTAIVQLWFPGMEGGKALADVLFGDVNPSGRLPRRFRVGSKTVLRTRITRARTASFATRRACSWAIATTTGRTSRPDSASATACPMPASSTPTLVVPADSPEVRVSLDVTHAGDRAGQEVVQVYVRDPPSAETSRIGSCANAPSSRSKPARCRR